jgi:hypothetical protein
VDIEADLTLHSRGMRRVPASVPATITFAALMFPWAMGLAFLTHDADGHHDHDRAQQARIHAAELIVHGHHHEDGTPPHQHALVLEKAAPLSTRVSPVRDPAPSIPATVTLSTSPAGFPSPPMDLAHGPPKESRTVEILRI